MITSAHVIYVLQMYTGWIRRIGWNHSMRSLWIVLPYGPKTDEIISNKKQSAWVVTVQRTLNRHGKGKSAGSWTQDLSLIKPPALCHWTTTDPTASYLLCDHCHHPHISHLIVSHQHIQDVYMNKFYKLWLHFNTHECTVGRTGIHHASQTRLTSSTHLMALTILYLHKKPQPNGMQHPGGDAHHAPQESYDDCDAHILKTQTLQLKLNGASIARQGNGFLLNLVLPNQTFLSLA